MVSIIKIETVEAEKNAEITPVNLRSKSWWVEIDDFLADTRMTKLLILALELDSNGDMN